MTRVVNRRTEDFDVYIGRGSKWGNPYSHLKNTMAAYEVGSREEAIESYRKYITEGDGRYLLNSLKELKDKRLGCYCKPLACHGDILVELINKLNND